MFCLRLYPVVLIIVLSSMGFASISQFAITNEEIPLLTTTLVQEKYKIYSQEITKFRKTAAALIGDLHRNLDLVQNELDKEKQALDRLAWNNTNYFEDYEDLWEDFSEKLSEITDSIVYLNCQTSRATNMLGKDIGRLETVRETNSMSTSRLLGARRQKYASSRLELIDIVQDFMALFSAGRRIINPFEALGAGMDLADVGVRLATKFGTKIAKNVINNALDTVGGGLAKQTVMAKSRMSRINNLRNASYQIS